MRFWVSYFSCCFTLKWEERLTKATENEGFTLLKVQCEAVSHGRQSTVTGTLWSCWYCIPNQETANWQELGQLDCQTSRPAPLTTSNKPPLTRSKNSSTNWDQIPKYMRWFGPLLFTPSYPYHLLYSCGTYCTIPFSNSYVETLASNITECHSIEGGSF